MRLLICAGGTGGGVYPALAVIQESDKSRDEILWVGTDEGMERGLIQHASIPYRSIQAAGVHGVGLRTLPRNLVKLARGTSEARRILREFNPDVLFFTGGFVSVPMALAGMPHPQVIFVPDLEPGLAIKAISLFATTITLVAESSKKFFSAGKHMVVTGYPTRKNLNQWTREAALAALELHERKPVLFVFGGSKGARSINQAVMENLSALLEIAQIVHVSGETDWEVVKYHKDGSEDPNIADYHIAPYLHEEMGAALRVADLVISRAGASTLGEFPLFGLPAILVPYPHAWRYQKVNADFLVSQGAALMIEDQNLKRDLVENVREVLGNTEKLQQMKHNMARISTPDAARNIYQVLQECASANKYERGKN
ncbi:MAG: undecaprenyldiphospho-muramoylpentapeptide beta-N-acetylglucosaminyltransferase [Chloroflexi bacterium]|nr:undecaprenyldiphospho-muramoylpentapeptide beta-N-acetylglucosaminyltransferase [Chloroflexota bacterium]